jgi:Domain of unknown function (DUF3846)
LKSMDELLILAGKVVAEAEANAKDNPTSDEIQIVIVEPMKKPYAKIIKNELGKFNDIVGGYMENHFIGKTEKGARLAIVCNEDGLRLELPFNRQIVGRFPIVGTFCLTAYNYEGDNVSLTDKQAENLIRRFSSVEVYV